MNKIVTLWSLALALIIIIIISRAATAVDYPHTSINSIACDSCHYVYGDGPSHLPPWTKHTQQDIDDTEFNTLCWSCHNDIEASYVRTHSSLQIDNGYGDWTVECRVCHNPHTQKQVRTYGNDSYLYSGISTDIQINQPQAEKSQLTMTGADWIVDAYKNMVLIPNNKSTRLKYGYKILSNTSDTITVDKVIDLSKVTPGTDTFAIIYGKLINSTIQLDNITDPIPPKSGNKTVRFFNSTGTNSFADGDDVYNGICEVCHTKTTYHRNDESGNHSHNSEANCVGCHSHESGFGFINHTAIGAVLPIDTCSMDCHGGGPDPVLDVHSAQCGLCHLDSQGGGPLVEPYETNTPTGGNCIDCHGALNVIHSNMDHNATPGNGWVVIHADNNHDDAGWNGPTPYFDVEVDCATCHDNELRKIHGNDCNTCHTAVYNTLNKNWLGGCQQGGCHIVFHTDSTKAHLPYEDTWNNTPVDCDLCHNQDMEVVQGNCLNCHAIYINDTTKPVTTTNAKATYIGGAKIDFSIWDNGIVGIDNGGKVGIGRTFYQLNGSLESPAMNVTVTEPDSYELSYWSMDQAGNSEATVKTTSFEVTVDDEAPNTTSNAENSYINKNVTIYFDATDNGDLGVENTFYSIDGNTPVPGSSVYIAKPNVTTSYTLNFWSEDFSGNNEDQDEDQVENTVQFTIHVIPYATLTLVYGNSDTDGSPCSHNYDHAGVYWTIWSVDTSTDVETLLKTTENPGNNGNPSEAAHTACPEWAGGVAGWSGVETESLLVTTGTIENIKYKVKFGIWWWNTNINNADYELYISPLFTLPESGKTIRY